MHRGPAVVHAGASPGRARRSSACCTTTSRRSGSTPSSSCTRACPRVPPRPGWDHARLRAELAQPLASRRPSRSSRAGGIEEGVPEAFARRPRSRSSAPAACCSSTSAARRDGSRRSSAAGRAARSAAAVHPEIDMRYYDEHRPRPDRRASAADVTDWHGRRRSPGDRRPARHLQATRQRVPRPARAAARRRRRQRQRYRSRRSRSRRRSTSATRSPRNARS